MTHESPNQKTTHFGYEEVPVGEKTARVAGVFHSVADKYDLMNDVMSFGVHRLWKRFTLAEAQARPGQIILDVAGGTGDLSQAFAKTVGASGQVILADINEKMLAHGRERLLNAGICGNVAYVQADAENLPFPDNHFDCITMAFGLRNVTDKPAALRSLYRVLKPGGKLLVLEFSKPVLPLLQSLYEKYSFHVIPKWGEWICQDAASYQYLVESIRMHPDQESLRIMMQAAEFEDVKYFNLSGGIVALHKGFKY
jgi:demethylmenaquinone methyltransferase/2-methoxy-6-polyprenyl-1,4-benzoquinol methylase